jgi:peptidoglycan/xylan/chitin deacetylase (PgdA/CDA1 family)
LDRFLCPALAARHKVPRYLNKESTVDMSKMNHIFVGWVDLGADDWALWGYGNKTEWTDIIGSLNSSFSRNLVPGRTITSAKDKGDENAAGNDLYIKFSDVRVDYNNYHLILSIHFIDPKTNSEIAIDSSEALLRERLGPKELPEIGAGRSRHERCKWKSRARRPGRSRSRRRVRRAEECPRAVALTGERTRYGEVRDLFRAVSCDPRLAGPSVSFHPLAVPAHRSNLRAGTLIMLYLLFHPRNQWLVDNRSRVDGERCVALTFDDGPDPVDTPKLLDLLRDKNVKATFFVVGKRADQYPEIVRRAWAEGHLIANHTWSHRNLFCFLTPSRLRAEIDRGTESVRRICGFRPRLFRSPVGLRHPLLRPYLKDAGLEYVSWTIRTRDTLITGFQRSCPAHFETSGQRRHHPAARSSAGRNAGHAGSPASGHRRAKRTGIRIRAGRPA